VDCGLFQGIKSLRLKNWDGFPVTASEVDAIILTHAHIDHSGFIPRLIKKGFRGKIYSTAATKEVCQLLLPDCGFLLEEEASYMNKIGKSKHKPALPLFTQEEAEKSLKYFSPVSFNEKFHPVPEMKAEFLYSGHILGAASVVLELGGRKLIFSGDVGRLEDPILYPPEKLPAADYLVVESTYGNRLHKKNNPFDDVERIVNETVKKNGVVVVPAFAVGRAQTLMYYLIELRNQNRIPDVPIYLNSPMASGFLNIFRKYTSLHKLSAAACAQFENIIQVVSSPEESKALNLRKGPMIIISASGMLTGGRVLHHLKAFAPFAENTILLTGFQAAGTRGEALMHGAEEIKIHGEYIPVKARVENMDNTSAHADYSEIIEWLRISGIKPRKTFVTHGEPAAADEMRRRLIENFGWECFVPNAEERITLE
jgi:metallo-beta-lactamase family protein